MPFGYSDVCFRCWGWCNVIGSPQTTQYIFAIHISIYWPHLHERVPERTQIGTHTLHAHCIWLFVHPAQRFVAVEPIRWSIAFRLLAGGCVVLNAFFFWESV